MQKPDLPVPSLIAALLAANLLLALPGCSRIELAYGSADLLLATYADDYLGLLEDQREGWEPLLREVLARHRRDELPYLAAFFDQALKVSQSGFHAAETACLVHGSRTIYQRHARLIVELVTPLLAELTPSQIQSLKARFSRELAEDQAHTGGPNWEERRRTRHYVKATEKWTGPLDTEQAALVADITGRMPDTRRGILGYRTRKRDQLIVLLESGADAGRLKGYLTAWLVQYRDLPTELQEAGDALEERLVELVGRLGQGLNRKQRAHLERRLSELRADLLKLQREPRLAPLGC